MNLGNPPTDILPSAARTLTANARWLLEKLSPSAGHIKYRDVIYQINIEDLTRLIERLKADQQDLQ
jgi:hypothetical protein